MIEKQYIVINFYSNIDDLINKVESNSLLYAENKYSKSISYKDKSGNSKTLVGNMVLDVSYDNSKKELDCKLQLTDNTVDIVMITVKISKEEYEQIKQALNL